MRSGDRAYVAIGGCAEQGRVGEGEMGNMRGDLYLAEDGADRVEEDDIGCGGGGDDRGEGGEGWAVLGSGAPKAPLVHATLGSWTDAMASDHGESAADGERGRGSSDVRTRRQSHLRALTGWPAARQGEQGTAHRTVGG